MQQPNPRTPGQPGTPFNRLTLGTSWYADRVRGLDRVSALEHVLDLDPAASPITVINTSNEYAQGLSEQIIGNALRRRGGVPKGFTIATKLDRDPETGSYSAERMHRSLEESRERLGLDVIPLLYLHDPEPISYEQAFADDGPVRGAACEPEFRPRPSTWPRRGNADPSRYPSTDASAARACRFPRAG